jgi:hypothetical protein
LAVGQPDFREAAVRGFLFSPREGLQLTVTAGFFAGTVLKYQCSAAFIPQNSTNKQMQLRFVLAHTGNTNDVTEKKIEEEEVLTTLGLFTVSPSCWAFNPCSAPLLRIK